MKKRSKLGWVGLCIGTIAVLAGLNYLDARVFHQLNPFAKDTPKASKEFNIKGSQIETGTAKTDQTEPKSSGGLRPEFIEYLKREVANDAGSSTDTQTPVELPEDVKTVLDDAETSLMKSALATATIDARTVSEEEKRIKELYALSDQDLLKIAKSGEVAAQNMLGLRYYNSGTEGAQSVRAGVDWLWKAAKSGYDLAFHNLTATLDHADVPNSQRQDILTYMKKHAAKGDANAQAFMGYALYFGKHGLEQDKATATGLLEAAAEAGNRRAQESLAYHVMLSLKAEDRARGVELLRQAAIQGSTEAQLELGSAFKIGKGVEKDPVMAVKWYEVAAMNGEISAARNLMFLHFEVDSPTRDDAMARAYAEFLLKSDPTQHTAYYVVGELYRAGRSYAQDFEQARSNFETASDLEYGRAQMALAEMYLDGQGVPQDRAKAMDLLRKSAQNYHDPAEDKLRELGEPVK